MSIGKAVLFSVLSLGLGTSSMAQSITELQHPLEPYQQAIYDKAQQGDVEAMAEVGVMYYEGHAFWQDYGKARGWFRKAAQQGNAQAMYYMGEMTYTGKGGEVDQKQAKEWYIHAVDHGDIKAATELGLIYYFTEFGDESKSRGVTLMEYAANKGDSKAMFHLGRHYFSIDNDKAEHWLSVAALEYPSSYATLGRLYEHLKDMQSAESAYEAACHYDHEDQEGRSCSKYEELKKKREEGEQ